MANESFVQLPPDGTGKQVDTFAITAPWIAGTAYRQSVVIADPATAAYAVSVDEQGRLSTHEADNGLLALVAEDVAQADGNGPGLLKPPYATADGSEPSLVVQISPNSQVALDQSQPVVIGGVGPDGATRRARSGADGGLQLSDAVVPPGSPFIFGTAGSACIIDTSGFQTIVVQLAGTWAATVNFYQSNDGESWLAAIGEQSQALLGVPVSAITSNAVLVFSADARYFRVSVTAFTSGQVIILPLLRAKPSLPQVAANIQSVSANGVVSAGANGVLPVAGNIAPGSAPTAYPTPVGGVDPNGLTRRIETDANGNVVSVGILPAGYKLGGYNVTYTPYTAVASSLTAAQSTVAPVLAGGVDQAGNVHVLQTDAYGDMQVRGAPATPASQSIEDLLTSLLAIQRVNSLLLAQIRDACTGSAGDEPDTLLADIISPATTFQNMIN